MKRFALGATIALITVSGFAATSAQAEPRQKATVAVSIVDDAGKSLEMSALPQIDQQRMTSLRNNMERWGNQQSQRVTISIRCTYSPLRCTLTVAW